MARAERMLRDEQIAHEVETYNQLIPDAGRAVGHAVARAHLRADAARVAAASSSASSTTSWFELPDGSSVHGTAVRRRRGAPHARRHHGRGALPEVRVHAGAGRDVRAAVRCASWSTIRSTDHDVVLDAEQHAALARRSASTSTLASPAVRIPIRRLDPGLPLPAAQHDGDAGLRPLRARATSTLEPARRARARADRHRDRDPRGLRGLRAAALGPRAAARRHGA